jgi:3-deoxy-D-manno-octulosonic-acid transferase
VRLLYALLSYVAFVVLAPFMLINKKVRSGWRERLGLIAGPAPVGGQRVWMHGASAGDLLALQPVIDELRLLHPDVVILLSTMTNSGKEMAERRIRGVDRVIFVPFDLPGAVRRTLGWFDPQVLVLEYTELWPNLIFAARGRGVALMLSNGRLSGRNLRTYRFLFRLIGNPLRAFERLLMRSTAEAERALALGALPATVQVMGNTKFDNLAPPSEAVVEALRGDLSIDPDRPLWVCGSTHEGEEQVLIDCFLELRRRHPKLVLLIAPRYTDRAARVIQLAEAVGLSAALRSVSRGAQPDVWVMDRIGELAATYTLADVVFVGGSFITRGGQNILEPAAVARPVLFGPHMDNFADAAELLVGRGGIQVTDGAALCETLDQLLFAPKKSRELGEMARQTVSNHQGAAARCAQHIQAVLAERQ